ncbi:MAG: hypothetical protein ABTQ25_13865 [Nitrosomonas ureae]
MDKKLDKKKQRFEKRRLKLEGLIRDKCDGINATLAKILGKEPSYVNRLLYPEGKPGKKNIGDEIMSDILDAFDLPEDWWVRSEEVLENDIDYRNITLGKLAHFKEVELMSEEEFRSQEGVFKALVESAKSRNKKE